MADTMIETRYRRTKSAVRHGFLAALVVASAACAGSDAQPNAHPGDLPAVHVGVRAYVDPDTGELGAPVADDEPTSALGAGAADQALEVVPGRTSAGGVMVDLRGHFSYGLRATVSNDGRVAAHCDARADTAAD